MPQLTADVMMDHEVEATRAANKKVANGLLARLLKYHGDSPPDEASSEAAEKIRRRMFAGTYRKQEAARQWAEHYRDVSMNMIAEETAAFPEQVMRRIVSEVAEKHNLPVRDIFKDRRNKSLVHARHEAMWRCSEETGYSFPRIGRFFGKDHTTVLHACRVHAARMAEGVATSPLAKPDDA